MERKLLLRFLLFAGLAVVAGTSEAQAQTELGLGHGETDVALSLYGAFSGTTNGNGTTQSPANSAGGIVELRHISNPLIGYEATYSYNRANQTYTACGTVNPLCEQNSVSANAHQISGDWIASLHIANLRPFALTGVGLLFNQPASGQTNTTSDTKPVWLYGAGLDWGVLPHLGLRFQYRGNLYKAPNLTKLFTSTNAFTHTAQPMIGAYFRF
jgi:opacity protein-like surface antigen